MSQEIDNKIVSLEFDSSKYDKNVNESIKMTDKLKSSLKFQDVETGFDKINKAIAKVTFSPMEKGIDSVYAKFTMMERFAVQAYDRMANKIINIGKKIADETFVTPRTAGFNEYEQRMDATKIIMTSTGESIEVVNAELEKLNKYAIDTIYSFSDMTNNIGKFTNAGVKLQDATIAMMGISNVAALSGSNAEQASRAMYNFSQSLGMGYVATRDWISIENANMATIEFKNQLIETAAEMGTLEKVSDGVWRSLEGNEVTAGKLRDTLSDKWLTSDVLIETLKRYGDESTDIGKKAFSAATEVRTFSKMIAALKESLQTGWGRTWEILIGNLQEAALFWTNINDVISGFIEKMANARNEMLETWKNTGGRNAALAGLVTLFKSLGRILGAIKEAFREVFPPITGDRLREFSIMFEKLMRKLAPSDKTIEKIQRTFRGLFSVLGIVSDSAKAFLKALFPMLGGTKGLASNILDLTASLGDWLTNLRTSIKEGRVFETVFGGVAKGLQVAINAIKMAAKFIKDLIIAFKEKGFTGAFEVIKNGFSKLMSHFSTELDKFHPVDKVKDLGKKIADTIEDWPVIGAISKFIISIKNKFTNNGIFAFIKNLFIDLVYGVKSAIDGFRNIDTSATDDFTTKLEEKFKPIKDLFSGLRKFLSSTFKFLGSLVKFIAVVGATLFDTLAGVFDNLGNGFGEITAGDAGIAFAAGSLGALLLTIAKGLKSVSGILVNVNSITGQVAKCFGALTAAINAEAITKIAKSIAILTVSLLVLSAIPIEKLSAATAVITALFANLVLTMRSYTKGLDATSKLSVNGSGVQSEGAGASIASIGLQLMLIASAVMTLVLAMAIITAIPYDGLVKGVAVLELLLASIANVAQKIGKAETVSGPNGVRSTEAVKMGGNILALAVLINVIANSIIKLMIAIAVMDKVTHGEALPLLAMTAVVLVAIMEALASMVFIIQKGATHKESKQMGKYTGAFVGLILAVSFCLSAVVGALIGLIGVIVLLYKYDMDYVLDDALGVLAKITLGIGIFIAGMLVLLRTLFGANSKDVNAGAMAKGIGGLIAVLSIVVLLLGELTGMMVILFGMAAADDQAFTDMTEFIKKMLLAILAIVAVFTIKEVVNGLTGKSSQAKQTAKNVLAISAFLITFSYAILAFAAAMTQIGNMPTKGLIKGGITFAALFAVLLGIVALVGKVKALQTGLMAISGIVKAIAAVMGVIAITFLSIVLSLRIFASFTEEELDNAIDNFSVFLDELEALAPRIATGIANILTMILSTVLQSLFGLIQTQFSDTMDFVLNMLTTIEEYAPDILNTIWNVVVIVLNSITDRAPEVVDNLVVALISVINSLAKAIDDHRKEILDAVDRLFDAVAGVVVEAFGRLLGKEGKELDKFVENWRGAVSEILKVLAALTVAIKAFAAVKAITSTLSVVTSLYDKLKYLPGAISDAGGAWNFFSQKASYAIGGLKTKIGALSTFSKFALGAGIAVAVGSAIASIINDATEAMDVCEKMSDEFQKEAEETARLNEENIQKINDIQKAYKDIDVDYDNAKNYSEKLKECIDSNGQIKAGMEDQAAYYTKKLNEVAGLRVEIEDGVVTAYDEQNNRIDLQGEKLEELMQKKRLMAKLDAQSEEIEKLRLEVDPGNADSELRKAIIDAKEDMENAANDEEQRTAVINYNKALEAYNAAMAQVEAFDQAEQAYISGDQEQIKKASEWLNRGFIDTTNNAYAVVAGINDIKTEQDALKESLESHMITQEAYDKKTKELTADLEAYLAVLKRIGDENPDSVLYYDYDVTTGKTRMGQAYGASSVYDMYNGTYTGTATEAEQDAVKDTLGWQRRKKKAEEEFKEIQKWYEEEGKNLDVSSETDMQNFYSHFASLSHDVREGLMKQYPEIRKAFEYLGENGALGFAQAIVNGDEETQEAARSMSESFLDALEGGLDINSPSKETYAIGEYAVDGLVNALTAGRERIKMAAKIMTTTLLTAFNGDLGSSPVIGSSLMGYTLGAFQTMVNGMHSKEIYAIGECAVDGAVDSLVNALTAGQERIKMVIGSSLMGYTLGAFQTMVNGMHSKEIYAVDGLVDGLVNALTAGQERIEMAAKSMTAALLTAFNGDLGSSPVITPVIGSPLMGSTLGAFQTMVNGMPPLNATVTVALTAGLDISPIVRSNEDLLAEVSLLREEMATMSYNITNIKMVMDTGALVGQLAGPMDTALGKRAALTRKGAY